MQRGKKNFAIVSSLQRRISDAVQYCSKIRQNFLTVSYKTAKDECRRGCSENCNQKLKRKTDDEA